MKTHKIIAKYKGVDGYLGYCSSKIYVLKVTTGDALISVWPARRVVSWFVRDMLRISERPLHYSTKQSFWRDWEVLEQCN